MSRVSEVLAQRMAQKTQGSDALDNAQSQRVALAGRRSAVEAEQTAAKARLSAASSGLVTGGGEEEFHAATDQVDRLTRTLKVLDEEAIPAAEKAWDDAAASLPPEREIQALQLRDQALSLLAPLYQKNAEIMAAQADVLTQIVAAFGKLREDFPAAYPTLFHADRRTARAELLRSVPPAVRDFMADLFWSPHYGAAHEDRFLPYDPQALDSFAERVDRPPAEAELAKFNAAALAPRPEWPAHLPPPDEPRPPLGPARWQGVEVRTPGNA